MKTTIITSVITTVVVNLLIHCSGLTIWIACGLLALFIEHKYDPCQEKRTYKDSVLWGIIFTGPISLLLMVCLFWTDVKSLIPFKFQSPITKIKTDVTPE